MSNVDRAMEQSFPPVGKNLELHIFQEIREELWLGGLLGEMTVKLKRNEGAWREGRHSRQLKLPKRKQQEEEKVTSGRGSLCSPKTLCCSLKEKCLTVSSCCCSPLFTEQK